MSIELVILSNHLTLCCPLLLLPSVFFSIRVSFNESVLRIRCPKYSSFSLRNCPSSRYSQESSPESQLKSIDSLVLSLLYGQLLHPYTTGKTVALTTQTFTDKVMSPFFKALSRFVIISILEFQDYRHHQQWLWRPRK